MNPTEVEFALRDLIAKPSDPADFPYELIDAHGASKTTITKLRSGDTNKAEREGDVLWAKRLYYRAASPHDDVATTVRQRD